MRELITLLESKSKEDISIVELSYSDDSLAPIMSRDSMKLHYGKLAHAYADRYNNNEGDSEFNYAGAMLHNIFFTQFRESRNKNEPNGPIGNLIKQKFKTFEDFKTALYEQAKTIEGSGWVYLARDGSIKIIHNHQLREDILILVDMWEHAYILDYGTDKERYIDKLFNIVDWNSINARWGAAYK